MWTVFFDMHSGGNQKLEWQVIFIEAPIARAVDIFIDEFKINPYRISCSCCGPDYSLSQYPTLAEACEHYRGSSNKVIYTESAESLAAEGEHSSCSRCHAPYPYGAGPSLCGACRAWASQYS